MAWETHEFEGVSLPIYDIQRNVSPGQVDPSLLDSVGGVANYFGSQQQYPRKTTIPISGVLIGEQSFEVAHDGAYIVDHNDNYIVSHDAYTDLRSQIAALWRKVGAYGQLWRRWHTDSTKRQWKMARLMHAPYPQSYEDVGLKAHVDLLFETQHIAWREETEVSHTVAVTNGVLKQILAHNDGDKPIDNLELTIARTSGTITDFHVTGASLGIDMHWTGTIGAGQSVVLDNGSQTIRRGDTDVYSGLSFTATHTASDWLPLRRGQNAIVFTITGGNADVILKYYHERF